MDIILQAYIVNDRNAQDFSRNNLCTYTQQLICKTHYEEHNIQKLKYRQSYQFLVITKFFWLEMLTFASARHSY